MTILVPKHYSGCSACFSFVVAFLYCKASFVGKASFKASIVAKASLCARRLSCCLDGYGGLIRSMPMQDCYTNFSGISL